MLPYEFRFRFHVNLLLGGTEKKDTASNMLIPGINEQICHRTFPDTRQPFHVFTPVC